MKLTIEKVVYGGSGLAHLEVASGRETIFVPFTLPGETVEAHLNNPGGALQETSLDRIITPSPDRISPRCIHFGTCGGCQYQHASYDAQLQLKKSILEETLQRSGLDALPPIEVHAAQPWEYRNRIRLRVALVADELRIGYLRRASSEFLPIEMCPISAPLLLRAAEAFLQLDSLFRAWTRAVEEIELFTSDDEQKLQVVFFLRHQPAKGFAELCAALKEHIPQLTGAGVQIIESAGRGRKSLKLREGVTWGTAGLNYNVAGETYWVSRGSFFQVNRLLIATLIRLATEGHSGRLAWDLYAGVGLFSRVLAKQFAEVVAVEAAEGDLTVNLRGPGQRAIAATTVEFLRQAVLQRDRPDLIVMDPPRAGVGAEVCSLLARIAAPQLVYVSCDPTTLGRDLRMMVDSGYRLNQLHLVDMFPQTFHQETVAVLGR
jgi:23S rRNA (uracil1939-C5)-methyltransferase